jgi:hydrogenase nickel incorporation protein HypA/HybF
MHEMSIAQSIVEIVEDVLDERGNPCVEKVFVAVGRMAGVVPESLEFSFEAITAGTRLEGAELVIDHIPVRARCESCGHAFEVESYVFRCERCEGTALDIVNGDELAVREIEVH